MRSRSLHRPSRCFAWVLIGLVGTYGCTLQNLGQQQQAMRNHVSASGQSLVDAVAPIFDAKGRALSSQGRDIERNLMR